MVNNWVLLKRKVELEYINYEGILSNLAYFRYLQLARMEYLRAIGFLYSEYWSGPRGKGYYLALASIKVDFHKPLYFDEDIEIGCRAKKIGNKSLSLEYKIFMLDGSLVCSAESVHVFLKSKTHTKVILREELPELVKAMEKYENTTNTASI